MDRRVVPFLVVVAGMALVFWFARQKTPDGTQHLAMPAAAAAGSNDPEPTKSPEPPVLAPQTNRTAIASIEPAVNRLPRADAPEEEAHGGVLSGKVVNDVQGRAI